MACGSSSSPPAPTFRLSVGVSSGGAVTGSPPSTSCSSGGCSSALAPGTAVTLTATTSSGWTFAGWSGDCTGTGTCSLTMSSNHAVSATFTPNVAPGANLLPLTVNGASCGGNNGAYPNKPCVQVTVCLPGTSTCTTVDDVLLDTGSYGLRLFKEVVPFSLPLAPSGIGTLAECVQYLDGSSHWGPVASADVVLGGEPAVRVPIQLIDSTFGPAPASCVKPETFATGGFNGILGVGLFAEDCGAGCASNAANKIYFTCTGGTCGGAKVALSSQVPNPVARLPSDNNGVIVVLPSVVPGGQLSVTGSLILGIDTQPNNASSGATAYPASPQTGNLETSYDGVMLGGFLDTGSNGLFFPAPRSGALPECTAPNSGWFCPALTTSVTATNAGTSGSPSGPVTFSIANAAILFNTSNNAFGELGGPLPAASGFDFGLPFFFGQKVLVGIEGKSSALGAGPYFAY
jgi:uncharacterized repeat protein (TIGR02543 family)